jgi:MFS family permease
MTGTSTGTVSIRNPFGWRFTAPLLIGSTLNPINSSMLAVALVAIGADFGAGPAATASLISVLYLCSAVSQPTMGKLSSLFGPRRIYLTGIFILLAGGIVGTLAPSFAFLILSRALIGIGTSACFPTAMALVRKRADDTGSGVPTRVIGNFAIAAQVTTVVGLPLGGFLMGAFGWRALFAVNIPFGLTAATLTFLGVAPDPPVALGDRSRLVSELDLPGIALFAGAVASLLIFLSNLATPAWWLLGLFFVLAAALYFWDSRTARPLIDFRMLAKNRPLQRTYLRQILALLASYAALYGTSQWMEQSVGLSASAVAFVLLPLSGLSIVTARVISGKGWIRWPLILTGVSLIAVAGVMLAITSASGIPMLVLMSLLFGFANGCNAFGNNAALYIQAPAAQIAVAAGLLRTSMYIGAIFSSSLIGITFGASATDAGFHLLALFLGAIGIAIALLAGLDRSIPKRAV